jgi:hypothetical protein
MGFLLIDLIFRHSIVGLIFFLYKILNALIDNLLIQRG